MNWHYLKRGEAARPVSETELRRQLATGELPADTPVWQPLLPGWLTASQAGLLPEASTPPHCTVCGKLVLPDDLLAYSTERLCANCKPGFFQRVREGAVTVTLAPEPRWAGFGLRAAAKFIDLLLLNILLSPFIAIVMIWGAARRTPEGSPDLRFITIAWTILGVLIMIAQAAYHIVFVVRWGATPGKRLLGLCIVRADGSRVGAWRAAGRYFAEMVSSALCWLGYLLALFDPEKRTLHDQLAGTRVVVQSRNH